MQFVPVVDSNQKPLMPTTPNRAASWIRSRKATPFWKKGIFCVRLNQEPSAREYQDTAIGIDPGSKREGFTVGSDAHQYLNVQTKAVDWVKDAIEVRRNMRRARRFRNTPCRANRQNRKRGGIPPSTFARWNWKLRIVKWIAKVFPVTHFNVEDIGAVTKKGQRKWNSSFSPLEVGKKWFYAELRKIATTFTQEGWETYNLRIGAGLKKSKKKLAETFSAHCVDSYILMRACFGSYPKPENEKVLFVTPLRFHRRQLHMLQFAEGNLRKSYGGTRSMGITRGTLVQHPKHGLSYVGGSSKSSISLHSAQTGKRLCQNAKPEDVVILTNLKWRAHSSPCLKARVSCAKV